MKTFLNEVAMNLFTQAHQTRVGIKAIVCTLLLALAPAVGQAQPSQKPLISSVSGAKPNLMLTIDNSGSMAFHHHETYNVTNGIHTAIERRNCRADRFNGFNVPGGEAEFDGVNYLCYRRTLRREPRFADHVSMVPQQWFPEFIDSMSGWNAQRSSEVNPIYYNPRIRYTPRVDSEGNAVALDPADTVVFISNQRSANFVYDVLRNPNNDSDIIVYHSMFSDDAITKNFRNQRNSTPPVAVPAAVPPTNYTSIYRLTYTRKTPVHVGYAALDAANPAFTYYRCTAVVTNASGQQTGCTAGTAVDVTQGTGTITLPSDHKRDECNNDTDTCTMEQERTNVMNWYRYYSTRSLAAATAIGQALADPKLSDQMRIGYMNINRRVGTAANPIDVAPGGATADAGVMRGVRMHTRGEDDADDIYTWLYTHLVVGGTPLHNSLDKVASYYRVPTTDATENPWAKNPSALASGTNEEMTCRRSFNLLFSDGGWNNGTATNSTTYTDADNILGIAVTAANKHERQYKPTGEDDAKDRKYYVPYPHGATSTLADLSAQYFWHEDLRTSLDNDIRTSPGQPTNWQNMTTYTVGYLIRPSGEVPGATTGLTFKQISDYQRQYFEGGYSTATQPSWPTGTLNSGGTDADYQKRVDDFIHAGFTGGGKGFSAQTAEDVKTVFSKVLADILNSAGNDAGVAVSGANSGSATTTIQGRTKYSVSYRTIDNTGDIEAERLNADGTINSLLWSASNKMPAHDKRTVYSISKDVTPFEFTGRFDALPEDIRETLKPATDELIAADTSFVDYLRGKDPVEDAKNQLFRQRSTPIGAMVNPPSMLMGGNLDQVYDLVGAVEGAPAYKAYMKKKRDFPTSLYVATNAGVMHALNTSTGVEMAGYMPRRSLKRMLHYANPAYEFEYVLDGPISEHDLYITYPATETTKAWQHMAIGTGGRGEPLVYAVRAPLKGSTADSTANRTPEMDDFAWETGPDNINNSVLKMGYITTPARSGQTVGGDWVVVLPSGHYNGETDNKKHGLIVLDANNGKLLRNIALPDSVDTGRGLGGVTLIRKEKKIVGAYAGDANGNLWRFDLRGDKTEWKVAYDGTPIFTTDDHRPIYGAPAWQEHPEGGAIVVVATGILLEDDDVGDTDKKEAAYGIWDPTKVGEADAASFATRDSANLVEQTVVLTPTTSGIGQYYKMSANPVDWSKHHGWKLELGYQDKGERNLDQVQNFGATVFFTTSAIAESTDKDVEVCKASDLPVNNLYLLDAFTGSLSKDGTSFDILDEDGNAGSDKQGDDFVVARIATGGFSRGVVLPPVFKIPEPPKGCTGDACIVDIPDSLRLILDGTGPQGEDTPDIPCGTVTSDGALGALDQGTAGVGPKCPKGKSWSRTQYQLSSPASK
jgi:type IV pilus assembly protein PilY1